MYFSFQMNTNLIILWSANASQLCQILQRLLQAVWGISNTSLLKLGNIAFHLQVLNLRETTVNLLTTEAKFSISQSTVCLKLTTFPVKG